MLKQRDQNARKTAQKNSHERKEHKESAVDGVSNVGGSRVLRSDLVDGTDKVGTLTERAEGSGREDVRVLGGDGCSGRRIVPHRVTAEGLVDFGGVGEVGRVFGKRGDPGFDGGIVGGERGLGLRGDALDRGGLLVGVDEAHAFPELGDGDVVRRGGGEGGVHAVGETVADGDTKGSRRDRGARDDEVLEHLPGLWKGKEREGKGKGKGRERKGKDR